MAAKKTTAKKSPSVKSNVAKKTTAPPAKKTVAKKTTTSAKKSSPKAKTPAKTVSKTTKKVVKGKQAEPKTSVKKASATTKKDVKVVKLNKKSNKKVILSIVALIIVALLALVASGFDFGSILSGASEDVIVANGDIVDVNYIGSFTDGTVFDTSYETVAKDNDLYTEGRPYEPLSFSVGAGQMIKGFDAAVVGMVVGETKTITLAPEDAYGPSDSTRIIENDRMIQLDSEFNITGEDFNKIFLEEPVEGNIVTAEVFPWNFSVKNVYEDNITLKYIMAVGDKFTIPQTVWESEVIAMDNTTITINQNPDVGEKIVMFNGISGEIVAVSETTFAIDFNSPMAGKTLIFELTVENVTKIETDTVVEE